MFEERRVSSDVSVVILCMHGSSGPQGLSGRGFDGFIAGSAVGAGIFSEFIRLGPSQLESWGWYRLKSY